MGILKSILQEADNVPYLLRVQYEHLKVNVNCVT